MSVLRLLLWLCPLAILLIALCLPRLIWHPNFNDYIDFLKILIWPFTILIILFFFKEVFAYLFFSMSEFNFFGVKGNLRNVNEVILNEANKKYEEKINDEKRIAEIEARNKEFASLKGRLDEKEARLGEVTGKAKENLDLAKENLDLAKEIYKDWDSHSKKSQELINELLTENKQLKETLSISQVDRTSTENKNNWSGVGEIIDSSLGEPKS